MCLIEKLVNRYWQGKLHTLVQNLDNIEIKDNYNYLSLSCILSLNLKFKKKNFFSTNK